MRLGLDVDIHKLEAEKLRKGKNKAEEDLDSLKIDYKKLRLSLRTAGLGKTSEQWRQEIKEEKAKVVQWEKKFQDARARESILEKNLLECRNEEARLKAQIAELESSLHLCRSRNSMIELRVSLSKIEELKKKIEELEDALRNSELRVELLEKHNEQYQEQLHHLQSQIRDRDYISLRYSLENQRNGSKTREIRAIARIDASSDARKTSQTAARYGSIPKRIIESIKTVNGWGAR
ncbi:myosin-9-like [Gossypium hirsutum]|uniref:Myosin-9-like n=1 Tax=Gossypium hirsutum TaxID=3635 RepID=A0ABM3BA04_GOSHI|nr:myosin-9-like [Gossypium hirsutum]